MPAVDFCQLALEESPLNETTYALATTPNRISTNLLYPPARAARVTPAPDHLRRNDELRGIRGEVKRLIESYDPAGTITERAYADDLTFLFELMGFVGVNTPGGATVTGPESTTAVGVNALNSATLNVASTIGFPSTGTFIMGGTATTYTGKTATSFTGCSNHAATTGGEVINSNVPVGAQKWVFNKRDAIDAKTARLRINYATENVLLEGYGFAIASASLNMAGELSADLAGLFMRRLAADTSTVPVVASSVIPPLRRGDLYVSALAGGGRLSDWTVNITNPLERIRSASIDPPSDWPDALEFGDDEVMVAGTIPKRILTGADMDALIAATSFSMLARWQSDKLIGATTRPYTLQIDMPACQYVGGDPDEMAQRRRFGFSPDWFAAYDETAGYDARITLVNGVSAINTFV